MEVISRLRCLNLLGRCKMHTSAVCSNKYWRREVGLPLNKNSEGPLRDLPDYTFLDGRPTPIGFHQKERIIKQRQFAEKMIEMISEVDFAKQRQIDLMRQKEEETQRIIGNRLKTKGHLLLKKNK